MNIALRRFLHNHGNIATEGRLQGFFIEHSRPTIGSTIHSRPLDSLKHCICTTIMTNIRPDRDSNLVPPGYKPQSIRMSHRGRPGHPQDWAFWCVENTCLIDLPSPVTQIGLSAASPDLHDILSGDTLALSVFVCDQKGGYGGHFDFLI